MGVLKKEGYIQWLTGLSIHIALTGGQSIIPSAVGYTVATGCRETAGWMVDKGLNHYEITPNTKIFIQATTSHIAAYSYSYPYGFRLGLWLKPPVQAGTFSQAEALNIFGLHKNANSQEIRKKYRELGQQYHPDKCHEDDCQDKMIEINSAYQVLTNRH